MSRRLPLAPWISTISGPLPMLSAWTRWPFTSRMRPSGGKAASARASWARASSCATTQSRASASRQARAILTANGMKIEGRCLVNLVDPVAVKQMRMAAPAVLRRARGIVAGIVIAGQGDRRAIVHVAIIFLLERVAVIFKVVEDVERAMRGILDQAGTDLVTVQKDVEIGYGFDLDILLHSDEVGPCLVEDAAHRALYIFNHLEYDSDTLKQEYDRDVNNGTPVALPCNYYPGDDPARPPQNRWRSHAHLLYGNWINQIYQTTPFDLHAVGR